LQSKAPSKIKAKTAGIYISKWARNTKFTNAESDFLQLKHVKDLMVYYNPLHNWTVFHPHQYPKKTQVFSTAMAAMG